MTAPSPIDAPALRLVCVRSSAGQTVELEDATGTSLGACDDFGTLTGPGGEVLLRAPFGWEQRPGGAQPAGTDAFVAGTDADGGGIGWVRLARYKVTPRSSLGWLKLQDATGAVAGTLEPAEDVDDQLALAGADGVALGRMTLSDKTSGLRRSTMTFDYELGPEVTAEHRPLLLVAALRYRKLLTEGVGQDEALRRRR